MLFRDLSVASSDSAAPGGVDQRPGLVTMRILEGRAAGAAAQRLRFLAGSGDGVHLRADRFRVARFSAESGFDDDSARRHLAVAVGVAELFQRPFDDFPRAQYQPRGNEDVADLATVSAAVHPHEATDGTGDSAQEFEAGNAVVARVRRDENAARPAATAKRRLVQLLGLGERLPKADHDAGNAAVADDQVGA